MKKTKKKTISKKKPGRYKLYKTRYAIDIYRWALAGTSDKAIAVNLGVSWGTISQWKRRHAAVRYAFWRATKDQKQTQEQDWSEYVRGRLPVRLQKVWDEMCVMDKEVTGYGQARALLKTKPKRMRQQLLIYAVLAHGFNLTKALHRLGIHRRTLLDWMENDPAFTDLLHEAQEIKKDFFEEGLVKLVRAGDSPATIFANRTQNRDRGYGEKTEVVHSGQVVQWTIPVQELDLPTETLRTLLTALKQKKLAERTAPRQLVEAQVIEVDGDGNHDGKDTKEANTEARHRTPDSRQHGNQVQRAGDANPDEQDLPGATVGDTQRLRPGTTRIKSL